MVNKMAVFIRHQIANQNTSAVQETCKRVVIPLIYDTECIRNLGVNHFWLTFDHV